MWLEVLYWIDHVWSTIECACGPSERLDAPSICKQIILINNKMYHCKSWCRNQIIKEHILCRNKMVECYSM